MNRLKRVVVVGGGRMGSGIAHAFLLAGSSVHVRDVDGAAVARSLEQVRRSVSRAYERGQVGGHPEEMLKRLGGSPGLDGLGQVDLLIEAVPERPDLKTSVLSKVSSELDPGVIIATNTSSISVSELSLAVRHPERFLGMHFFNPVPVSRLVEVVRAEETAESTVMATLGWVEAIGKVSITVNDTPGFATSRLGLVIGLEAIRMFEEGVASAEEIDRGMVEGYGFPIGPLRLTDIVGLDVRLEIAAYLESRLGDRFAPPALLRDKVAAGELGRKSGRGFFTWTD